MKKTTSSSPSFSNQAIIRLNSELRMGPLKPTTGDTSRPIQPEKRPDASEISIPSLDHDLKPKMNIYPVNDTQTEWRLTLDDDINLETYRQLEQHVVNTVCQTLFRAGATKLTVDLTTTKRLDSLGLQLLLLLYKKCAGRELPIILLNPSGQISRVLRILQFDRIFTIEQTEDIE